MPLVFFSGGIDSTTLAFDLARHPYRYGASKKETLYLLTYGKEKKRQQLADLVEELHGVSTMKAIKHRIHEVPLDPLVPEIPESWDTLDTLSARYQNEAIPFTPGLHMWLAALAENILFFEKDLPHGKQQAMFGFHYTGVNWKMHDEGTLDYTDASPEFVESLNKIGSVWYRAPFLDSRMDKLAIVKLGQEVGVPFEMTSSCVNGWMEDCGKCCQCMRRMGVLKAAGVECMGS